MAFRTNCRGESHSMIQLVEAKLTDLSFWGYRIAVYSK